VGVPANAQGRTLLDALAVDEDRAAALGAADRARIVRATQAADQGRLERLSGDTRRRVARAGAVLVVAGMIAWLLRRRWRAARAGVMVGLAAMALGAAAYYLWFERVSFSADRDARNLAISTLLLSTVAAGMAFLWPLVRVARGRLGALDACALGLGAVVGASPLAAIAFVHAGAYTPRILCEPAWIACGPLVAYGIFAPAAGAATVLALLACLREATSMAREQRRITPPPPGSARPAPPPA
jgi:hypothetical protein